MENKEKLLVKGLSVSYKRINGEDYICLTDMAKYNNAIEPRFIVYNWMRNKETLKFLSLWEIVNNPNFNRIEFDTVTKNVGTNSFVITPIQWIEKLKCIGIVVKTG